MNIKAIVITEDHYNALGIVRSLGENNIEVILHYEEKKGHDGLSQEEAIKFLYEVLDK